MFSSKTTYNPYYKILNLQTFLPFIHTNINKTIKFKHYPCCINHYICDLTLRMSFIKTEWQTYDCTPACKQHSRHKCGRRFFKQSIFKGIKAFFSYFGLLVTFKIELLCIKDNFLGQYKQRVLKFDIKSKSLVFTY